MHMAGARETFEKTSRSRRGPGTVQSALIKFCKSGTERDWDDANVLYQAGRARQKPTRLAACCNQAIPIAPKPTLTAGDEMALHAA
jgi:hypothetical protein